MGWSVYQSNHGVLSVYHFLEGVQCNMHSTHNIKCLPSMTHLSIQGNTLDKNFSGGFLGREGSGTKDIWPSCNSLTYEIVLR